MKIAVIYVVGLAAVILLYGCSVVPTRGMESFTCAYSRAPCDIYKKKLEGVLDTPPSRDAYQSLPPTPQKPVPSRGSETGMYAYPSVNAQDPFDGRLRAAFNYFKGLGYKCVASRTVPMVLNKNKNSFRLGVDASRGDVILLAACTDNCYGVSYNFQSATDISNGVSMIGAVEGFPAAIFHGTEDKRGGGGYFTQATYKNYGVNIYLTGEDRVYRPTQFEMHVFSKFGVSSMEFCARDF